MSVLGRGLDALLKREGDAPQPPQQKPSAPSIPAPRPERPKESVFWLELAHIRPNPEQPRKNFDEEKIKELAESIRVYGILQPIVVSKQEHDVPGGVRVEYQIIAGERRFRAARLLGLEQIPAIIRKNEPQRTKLELALIENVQREDLNPIEKARAYKRLTEEFGLQAKEVGLRVGKSRESVANTMRLLMLPAHIQEAVADGRLGEGQVRPLLTLSAHPADQLHLYERVIAQDLPTREVERAVQETTKRLGMPAPVQARRRKPEELDQETKQFEADLAGALGTRVMVKRMRGGRGRISIDFFSEEELQHITGLMQRLNASGRGEPEDEGSFSV